MRSADEDVECVPAITKVRNKRRGNRSGRKYAIIMAQQIESKRGCDGALLVHSLVYLVPSYFDLARR